jgi:hypothetical protein
VFRLIDEMRTPDRFEDRAMRQHPPGILGQKREQLELLGSEPYLFAVSEDPKSLAVDHEAAADDRIGQR